MSQGYSEPMNHLLDEIVGARLSLKRLELSRTVREALEGRTDLDPTNGLMEDLAEAAEQLEMHREVVAEGVQATRHALPLPALAERLSLSEAERRIVSTLFAVEVDPVFARRCAALHGAACREAAHPIPCPYHPTLLPYIHNTVDGLEALRL